MLNCSPAWVLYCIAATVLIGCGRRRPFFVTMRSLRNTVKGAYMFSNKMSLIIAVLMIAASIGAVVAKPAKKVADEVPISLEKMVPKSFGDWRELPDQIGRAHV